MVRITGAAFTVRVSCLELLPRLLVALTLNVETPRVLGVPPIAPVWAFNVRPAGNPPLVTDQVIGVPPEAARRSEYAFPTSPAGSEVVVNVGADASARADSSETPPGLLAPLGTAPATLGVPAPESLTSWRANVETGMARTIESPTMKNGRGNGR